MEIRQIMYIYIFFNITIVQKEFKETTVILWLYKIYFMYSFLQKQQLSNLTNNYILESSDKMYFFHNIYSIHVCLQLQ